MEELNNDIPHTHCSAHFISRVGNDGKNAMAPVTSFPFSVETLIL